MNRVALACFVLLAASCKGDGQHPPATAPDAAPGAAVRIEADVRFLADDLLEGREAGSRGYDLAALYVAQRYRAIGLAPAGEDGSYFQRVPLLRATRVAEGAQLVISRHGARTALRFGEQFLPALNYNAADAGIEAPAVFVGQAVHAPELQHDDFRGLDLRGKIAVLFQGAPPKFDNDRRAFYSSGAEKLRALSERGAVGAVFVGTDDEEQRSPWARAAGNWAKPGMRLRTEGSPLGGRDATGTGLDTFPQLRVVASVSAASAGALLSDDGRTTAQLFYAAKSGTLQGFDLPGTIALRARTTITRAESRNVVAKLAGGDAKLGDEHVVFTAHLDHVGIGVPVNGDSIYNGALDNALGVAVMLEAAHQLAHAQPRPRRSLLFVAVTAEEKGLLGAEWFARQPTVPRGSLVANVNMDMPVLLAPTDDLVPIGIEHSSLQALVRQAAKEVGVALSPDPFPEEVVFVRSDQYPFVRAGIPAVYLTGGVDASSARDDAPATSKRFLRERYHQPGDDVSQPIQYADAARLARLNASIGRAIGNAPQRPTWNAGDFFGERFGTSRAAAATR